MSTTYNNNLERVRHSNSLPKLSTDYSSNNHEQESSSVNPNQQVIVGPLLHPAPYDELYSTKYINEHTDGYARRSTARVYDSPFKNEQDQTVYKIYDQSKPIAHNQSASFDSNLTVASALPRAVKTAIGLPGPEVIARYIEPKFEPDTTYGRSYKDISYHENVPHLLRSRQTTNSLRSSRIDPTSFSLDRTMKLRDIQDRWSKTQAQRNYHTTYPETVPDVGHCTIRAKKEILLADIIQKQRMTLVR
jgi:hypothetical protein